jgi:hypothetical protein
VSDYDADAREATRLVKAIMPLLKGRASEVQGAALADLLAIWLAGHINADDPENSDAVREVILEFHLEAVRSLIPVNFKQYVEPRLKREHGSVKHE